jgi:uncharacterized protein with von Willebrand factor type A (vWA) domain
MERKKHRGMVMAQGTMEKRLAELERELAALKARVDALTPPTDWRGVVERFGGDEDLQRIFEAGRKIREEDRRRTKPKSSKSKRRTPS